MQVRQRFEVAIRGEKGGLVLPAERCKHHVHLRKCPAFEPQLVEDFTIQTSCLCIDRPQANMAQELLKSAAILCWLGCLLDAGFQLAQDGITRHETLAL